MHEKYWTRKKTIEYDILMSTNIKDFVKTHPQTMVCYHKIPKSHIHLVAQHMPLIDRLSYVFVYVTPAHLSPMHRKVDEEKIVYEYYANGKKCQIPSDMKEKYDGVNNAFIAKEKKIT